MNSRLPIVALALLAAGTVARAGADVREIPAMRIHSTIAVDAKPGAVWSELTTGRRLVTWSPAWKSGKNATVFLTRVGDVLESEDAWGHHGRSVVTHLEKGRELRLAHESDSGEFLCRYRITLTPTGKGTQVDLEEQFTDESPAANRQATAGKMEKEAAEMLAALKRGAEAHHGLAPSLHVTR